MDGTGGAQPTCHGVLEAMIDYAVSGLVATPLMEQVGAGRAGETTLPLSASYPIATPRPSCNSISFGL